MRFDLGPGVQDAGFRGARVHARALDLFRGWSCGTHQGSRS